jgi:glycosidase
MKKAYLLSCLLILIIFNACKEEQATSNTIQTINWNNEVIYHVMPRSFYDSDGDLHGDLNGFVQKLDYLKELGVTTILFTPLYESGFYHNYFPTNYENIDPEYGTKEDYINFVKAVHAKGMKFLMDMETQYAQSGNIWFDDSYQNPSSQYSDFIYYSDSLNQYPEQIFMKSKSPLYEFTAWPGDKHNIVFLDLNNERVKQWMIDFYAYWVDPNQDGNFDDGVDGFRIDHIMDDLDYKGLFTNMYQDFWKPIFEECQRLNPKVFVLGEQSNWNEYGDEMVRKSGATAAFNFPLKFAISGEEGTHDMYADFSKNSVSMDPARIHDVVNKSLEKFSDSIYLVNFIENHDTNRWATLVQENEGQNRVAASLNILLPGIPFHLLRTRIGSYRIHQRMGIRCQSHSCERSLSLALQSNNTWNSCMVQRHR